MSNLDDILYICMISKLAIEYIMKKLVDTFENKTTTHAILFNILHRPIRHHVFFLKIKVSGNYYPNLGIYMKTRYSP